MSRLIDADVLDARLKCTYRYFQIAGDIAEAPTVDPIRAAGGCYCRECEYYLPDHICGWNSSDGWLPDDFCSYGRRREDNA